MALSWTEVLMMHIYECFFVCVFICYVEYVLFFECVFTWQVEYVLFYCGLYMIYVEYVLSACLFLSCFTYLCLVRNDLINMFKQSNKHFPTLRWYMQLCSLNTASWKRRVQASCIVVKMDCDGPALQGTLIYAYIMYEIVYEISVVSPEFVCIVVLYAVLTCIVKPLI